MSVFVRKADWGGWGGVRTERAWGVWGGMRALLKYGAAAFLFLKMKRSHVVPRVRKVQRPVSAFIGIKCYTCRCVFYCKKKKKGNFNKRSKCTAVLHALTEFVNLKRK